MCYLQSNVAKNHFSFYFQILSLKFVEIPAATRGVSPSDRYFDTPR
jgi:hypothetical protein